MNLPTLEKNPSLTAWLTLPGSLTVALRAALPEFCVKILFEGQQNAYWHRDVFLCDGNKPYVFARTRLDFSSPFLPLFQQIGSRPIGDWLYAQPQFRKDPTQALDQTALLDFLSQVPYSLDRVYQPGRFTRYGLDDQAFEITELFLEIPAACP